MTLTLDLLISLVGLASVVVGVAGFVWSIRGRVKVLEKQVGTLSNILSPENLSQHSRDIGEIKTQLRYIEEDLSEIKDRLKNG